MSIQTVRPALATLQRQIIGINTAYAFIPRSITLDKLPCFITFIGRSVYDLSTLGETMVLDDRLYDMTLFTQLVTDGVDGEAEESLYPFIPRVRDFFLARRGLLSSPTDPAVFDARLVGDAGIATREFPLRSGKLYATAVFQMRVREIAAIEDAV